MVRSIALASALLLTSAVSFLPAQTTKPTVATTTAVSKPGPRPVPAIQRVVVISIDGCRPDVMLRSDTPNLRRLMDNGSFTMWARTTAVALTLPSHVSMMTGVIPVRHGIHWNEDLETAKPYYPKAPTLFEIAAKHGYTTALVSGKSKFNVFAKPGVIDWAFIPAHDEDFGVTAGKTMEEQSTNKKTTADTEVVAEASIRILTEHRPQVLMIHFPSSDVVGHGKGWGTPEHVKELARIDACIGRILTAEQSLGLFDQTAFIVTADHGGAGRTHGADDERSRRIPWILSGPGVRKNYDLTRLPELEVNTYDTFATAAYLLGLPLPKNCDGKPIKDAIENRELLSGN